MPTDKLTAKTTRPLGASPMSGSVTIGGADFYTFEAKQGELVELSVSSSVFDPVVRLNGPDGRMIGDNDDGGDGKNSSLTVPIPEDGIYIASVFSYGLGGSGNYEVRRKFIAPSIAIGEAKTGSLSTNGAEIWSFTAKSGQTLLLRTLSESATLSVVVYGPKGEVVGTDQADGLKVLRLAADGAYTIWVRAGEGSGTYRIRLLDLDK